MHSGEPFIKVGNYMNEAMEPMFDRHITSPNPSAFSPASLGIWPTMAENSTPSHNSNDNTPKVELFRVKAHHSYAPQKPTEIGLSAGDEVIVYRDAEVGWAFGLNLSDSRKGFFPINYTVPLTESKSCADVVEVPQIRPTSPASVVSLSSNGYLDPWYSQYVPQSPSPHYYPPSPGHAVNVHYHGIPQSRRYDGHSAEYLASHPDRQGYSSSPQPRSPPILSSPESTALSKDKPKISDDAVRPHSSNDKSNSPRDIYDLRMSLLTNLVRIGKDAYNIHREGRSMRRERERREYERNGAWDGDEGVENGYENYECRRERKRRDRY
ncbi:hypothetical protein K469DRAFT_804876 [Zopfia rhizophila CBS 207.26]|uniref:SH3 domain-containing protein n=1 Tax=Zopfia rhizophila CBS 207.26 TaxID=1314779 RepID=A0A6A6EL19_9PEZI|nr:hypothetical protein K469DRAFT_804876 [Zopfia rhizophila CBS 207.26]